MIIRKANEADLDALDALFSEARSTIAALGIDQWQNGYPSPSVIGKDIDEGRAFVVEMDGTVVATFALITDGEPTYDRIYDGTWLTGDTDDYVAIHRVAISVARRGSGLSTAVLNYAADVAKSLGRASLRIDTHRGNVVMRRMLEKHGFVHCGTIYLENGYERVAYEKILTP
jgi:predicted GNAT family N-acyltransferase